MSDSPVELTHVGAISTITINRPSSLNSLNRETLEALAGAIAQVADRSEVRCVIVTGAGDRAFVAGADIEAMSSMGEADAAAFAELGGSTFAALEALPVPVIAAVNGFALGGGCELAMACDFIYASNKAKFGQPEVKLGVLPGFGGTQRLLRRVSLGLARELTYTGRMLGAEEALRVGLVNAVVPRAELLDTVTAVANEIAGVGPLAVSAAKRVMLEGADTSLGDGVAMEARAFGALFASADQKEGMVAFLAKRPADFQKR